uniref:Uncharacterized protein n=1 Tax=Anguilla anguilla TaxID=7936 RepID=A0A0E9WT81_ANGAN
MLLYSLIHDACFSVMLVLRLLENRYVPSKQQVISILKVCGLLLLFFYITGILELL